MASKISYFWSEIGIKQIYICPDLNYGAAIHADKWIPVLPNTDAALWLGIAYTWLDEGTYDKDYIATHCDGFDWFERYVTGGEDGEPKTPEWAETKCSKGRKDIAEKFDGVFWNEDLQIPQGCSGCAHLLDDGWTVPRCVDSCATGALRFVDIDEAADELAKAERLTEGSHVYYLNLPKRWVAGQAIDLFSNEVVIGATCTLIKDGGTVAATKTDEFGDFWFKQVEPTLYEVRIEAGGASTTVKADATSKDVNVGAVELF